MPTQNTEHRGYAEPDEVREFPYGRVEIGRVVLEPGWRWSTDVKPIAGTELCEATHMQHHVSGRVHVVMADGSEFEAGPGDSTSLPQGHDAWVVGETRRRRGLVRRQHVRPLSPAGPRKGHSAAPHRGGGEHSCRAPDGPRHHQRHAHDPQDGRLPHHAQRDQLHPHHRRRGGRAPGRRGRARRRRARSRGGPGTAG